MTPVDNKVCSLHNQFETERIEYAKFFGKVEESMKNTRASMDSLFDRMRALEDKLATVDKKVSNLGIKVAGLSVGFSVVVNAIAWGAAWYVKHSA